MLNDPAKFRPASREHSATGRALDLHGQVPARLLLAVTDFRDGGLMHANTPGERLLRDVVGLQVCSECLSHARHNA